VLVEVTCVVLVSDVREVMEILGHAPVMVVVPIVGTKVNFCSEIFKVSKLVIVSVAVSNSSVPTSDG
jgi:hypothetical protein